MKQPTDLERCLAILILRTLRMSQDKVVQIMRCHKLTVGDSEKWLQQLSYDAAADFCNETAVKELVGRYLVMREEITREELISAGQVTTDAILRRHRTDYVRRQAKSSRKPSPVDKEERQLQQVEHIEKVQSLAKSTIASYSTHLRSLPFTVVPPTTIVFYDESEFASILRNYDALLTTFHDLVEETLWRYLAAHLGNKAERIDYFANKFIRKSTLFTGEHGAFSFDELKSITTEAQQLIDGGLAIMARTSDTKEWERHGLNPTCPFCPIVRRASS